MTDLTTKEEYIERIENMYKELQDAAEMLWVCLANVSEGDWTKQTIEWQEAAEKWRDNYLKASGQKQKSIKELLED